MFRNVRTTQTDTRSFSSYRGGTPFGRFLRQLENIAKGLAKPSHGFSSYRRGTPFGRFLRQLENIAKGLAKPSHGFSLIEVLVSLSIFTIVVTISVSTLYTLIEANARTRNSQSLATNLSFTLDGLTREIRTGEDYFCADQVRDLPVIGDDVNDCENGGSMLSFNEGGQSLTGDATPEKTRRIAYRLSAEGKLQRRLGDGNGDDPTDEPADWLDLTSDDINIEDLVFYVTGSAPLSDNDTDAPSVTIFLRGTVGDEEVNRTDFSIETTIAQRLLDI